MAAANRSNFRVRQCVQRSGLLIAQQIPPPWKKVDCLVSFTFATTITTPPGRGSYQLLQTTRVWCHAAIPSRQWEQLGSFVVRVALAHGW